MKRNYINNQDYQETYQKAQKRAAKINTSNIGIIAIPSGNGQRFKVGDKVKLRDDMGGFIMKIIAIQNNHYCTAKGYGKERHVNMGFLELI